MISCNKYDKDLIPLIYKELIKVDNKSTMPPVLNVATVKNRQKCE